VRKPLLGPLCSFPEVFYVILKVPDPLFGGLNLIGKLLGDFNGMLAVFFSHACRSVEQSQNVLAGSVQRIGTRSRMFRKGNNGIQCATHRNPRNYPPPHRDIIELQYTSARNVLWISLVDKCGKSL